MFFTKTLVAKTVNQLTAFGTILSNSFAILKKTKHIMYCFVRAAEFFLFESSIPI